MNLFRTATLLAALCIATGVPAGSSWAQTNSSSPQPATLDASAIGKVMSADGTARIEHAANVVVQANLSAGGVDLAKAGDLVYRGEAGARQVPNCEIALDLTCSPVCSAHLLGRMTHGELDGIAPKAAVILIGANNFGKLRWPAAPTEAGIEKDVERAVE